MNEEWRMMNDERWMIEYPMNYEWWMMNEEWSLMNPQWWPPKHIIHFESIRKVRRYSSCMTYDHVTFAEAVYKLFSNMEQTRWLCYHIYTPFQTSRHYCCVCSLLMHKNVRTVWRHLLGLEQDVTWTRKYVRKVDGNPSRAWLFPLHTHTYIQTHTYTHWSIPWFSSQ